MVTREGFGMKWSCSFQDTILEFSFRDWE